MTLAEFLTDPDQWLGREITVESAWLHSDGFETVGLTDNPVFDGEMVSVDAPWVARWLNQHIPPRPGASSTYMIEASVKGTVHARNADGVPVLSGQLYVVLRYSGSLHLQYPEGKVA